MSEGVPKRKYHEEIQVMNTDEMQRLGYANKKGKIVKMMGGDGYMVMLKGSILPVFMNGHSLRAWVEPLKEDLT